MDCGPSEYVCLFVEWLSKHPHFVEQVFRFIDGVWNEAGGWLTAFLKEHGQKLVAIVSFCFAVYRWWLYRERILHKRLEEYIRESDARLKPAASQTAKAILRPGRTAALPQPAFAIELEDILVQSRWDSLLRFSSIERRAERKLRKALTGIRRRQQIARAASQSLAEQQMQVHFLSGAIAASRARRKANRSEAWRDDYAALREFRKVLQFRTHDRDVLAKECEAFQLLRLGRSREAFQAYLDLQNIAESLGDQQERDLTIARAKRFRAQILQAGAAAGAGAAWTLIARQLDSECSLGLREQYGPYIEWDAIEQAEIHFVAAWIAHRLGFGIEEPSHLSKAETAYAEVLAKLPKRAWLVPYAQRKLREEANAGLKRIERAKAGDYDTDWLLV